MARSARPSLSKSPAASAKPNWSFASPVPDAGAPNPGRSAARAEVEAAGGAEDLDDVAGVLPLSRNVLARFADRQVDETIAVEAPVAERVAEVVKGSGRRGRPPGEEEVSAVVIPASAEDD